MHRIIEPPREDIPKLRQPLTPGELEVLEFFDRNLPPEWEIYLQPHLNGLKPDIVVMNPKVGIGVFEVKDWNLNAMDYFFKTSNSDPFLKLYGRKDGDEFLMESQNPIPKVQRYHRELFNLYCPRVGGNLRNAQLAYGVIQSGVIFTRESSERARTLFGPIMKSEQSKYIRVIGRDSLKNNDIISILPAVQFQRSKYFNEDLAKDIRGWLSEPSFAKDQRTPVKLSPAQEKLASTRTQSGYRRIKGPAGSGKSLVLASRAARLLNEGKKVLVVSYNITLVHYLRDLIAPLLDTPRRINQNATFLHFHGWCKDVCEDAGFSKEYVQLWSGYDEKDDNAKAAFFDNVAQLTLQALKVSQDRYDAILVDEGQDFKPLWWAVLRTACRPGGEMILVADTTQDVYGTARAWTDEAMTSAGFTGEWAQLKDCYRLPSLAQYYAQQFAINFLPKEIRDISVIQQDDMGTPCNLMWIQCNQIMASLVCAEVVKDLMAKIDRNDLACADITFLAEDTKRGNEVIELLDLNHIHTVSTFNESGQERRREKMSFYMGDARLKATTIHSFKGWEARMIVLYINNASQRNLALIYAGLTRIKRHIKGSWLTIVNSAPEFKDFGRTWPNFKCIEINNSAQDLNEMLSEIVKQIRGV